jgi:hypothetical protein
MPKTKPSIAILGAGPIGLEAALAAAERDLPFAVYDAAPTVAGHVRGWGHVRVFTPWDLNVSDRMRAALAAEGVAAPSGDDLPTGDELADRLYEPVGRLATVAPNLRLRTRVEAVGREGLLKHDEIGTGARADYPFRLLLTTPEDDEVVGHADVVLDCTGTYGNPNALGDGGIPAPGERTFADRIVQRLPEFEAEAEAWAGRTILLTGAGHSAQTAALELARFARDAQSTRVIWAVRGAEPDWGAVDDDPLPERAALNAAADELGRGASPAIELRAGRLVEALTGYGDRIAVTLRNGQPEGIMVDRILGLNGGVGDFTLYRQLQVHECYATAGPMKLAAALLGTAGGDCLAQESHGPDTLRNPEPGFFLIGAKSYGRNSQFLLRIGWSQVEDVFELLDEESAA